MRKFMIAFVVGMISTGAFAADLASQLQGYQVGACTLWHPSSGSMPGYICGTYPQTVTVADAYSYAQTIRALEARISDLEKKVAELQQPKPQQ